MVVSALNQILYNLDINYTYIYICSAIKRVPISFIEIVKIPKRFIFTPISHENLQHIEQEV